MSEHTCIKDDGGTPNRRCYACEEEQAAAGLKLAPGRLRCPTCKFELTIATIFAKTGQIGASKAEVYQESKPCPNDGEPMVRVTWREEADANRAYAMKLIDEIIVATGANSLPEALQAAAAQRSAQKALKAHAPESLFRCWERFNEEERHAEVEVGPARKAFYAGAQSFVAFIWAATEDEQDLAAWQRLERVYEELAEACKELKI